MNPSSLNAQKLFLAVAEPEVFFKIGVKPGRIDIMTSLSGLDFVPSWEHKVLVDFGGESAPVLCRTDVLQSKIAAGRIRDRRDIQRLARRKS